MHDMSNNETRYAAQTPPVLLLTFSRPSQAARVLERIKEARPPSLYVACDGPRPGRDDDRANVAAIHEMIGRIDWCGDVKTLFRDRNLGCGPAVSQAITWYMEQAGEGIILEDDCLPDPTFFRFCGDNSASPDWPTSCGLAGKLPRCLSISRSHSRICCWQKS